jgi:hypothetical protein
MDEYFLHVDMIVRDNDDATKFERLMTQFLGQGGLSPLYTLQLALKSKHAFNYKGYKANLGSQGTHVHDPREDTRVYRYVHLWRIPDLHDLDLAFAMTRFGDNTLYTEIHSLPITEVQNLLIRVASNDARIAPIKQDQDFVRATRHFSPRTIQGYLHGLNVLVPILTAQAQGKAGRGPRGAPHWHSIGNFQCITGELNSAVEIWQTDRGTERAASFDESLAELGDKLQGILGQAYRGHDREVREIFQLAPYFNG